MVGAASVLSRAWAASLGGASAAPLGAGQAVVAACDDTSAWTFEAVVAGGSVTAVEIGEVDDACAGGELDLVVTDGSTVTGDGTVTVPTGGTVTVPVDEEPAEADATEVHVVVVGP
jgi:hypothetical protein